MSELFKTFFEQANDPGFVIDLETRRLLEVNAAFVDLLGWTAEEIAEQKVTSRELVVEQDLETFDEKVSRREDVDRERYALRIRDRDGRVFDAELSVATIEHEGRRLVIGSLRDITAHKRLEQTLKEEISRQRAMTYRAAQDTVRIGQVLERLRSVPTLARELLAAETQPELIEAVVRELSAGDKFSYARVVLYVLDGGPASGLVRLLADTAGERVGELIRLESLPNVERAINQERMVADDLSYIVPMRNRRSVSGALLVQFHEFEKDLFDEIAIIRRAQEDTIRTIGNLVGLGIENLSLSGRLQHLAHADELTGVGNRRDFERRLEALQDDPDRASDAFCMVLVDIDLFKEINDRLGHDAGDRVLQRVAELLEELFPSAVAVCRFGGDEFAVLAAGGVEAVRATAERLRDAVEECGWSLEGVEPTRITVSVGLAPFAPAEEHRHQLVLADQALYRAKQGGRNRVEVMKPA